MLLVKALSLRWPVNFILSFIFIYLNHAILILFVIVNKQFRWYTVRHCNHQPCSHSNGKWCLLKLTNFIKANLYEVTFSLI